MSKLTKTVSRKVQKPGMPYGLNGDTIMLLPIDENVSGTKYGDIIAELDEGYLTVTDKRMFWTNVTFIPKMQVQL